MTDDELTEEEKKTLQEYLSGYGAQVPEEKHTLHTFLFRIATSDDTTKTGNLKEEELGTPEFPVRSYKSFALWSDKVIRNSYFKEYFERESEDTTSTSLSRDGFLDKLSVLTKKELADTTKRHSENKGWFRKKQPEETLT
jgi:hypothetical protein